MAEPADSYRLSGPATHGNLAVYFVRGDSRPGPVPLTLEEALVNKTVEVRETGSVNELQVMNNGGEAVYIQSGDIVKGGRQDRVLLVSMLLPPRSGIVPIPVFCVEQGRWSGRTGESATKFESAKSILPSREAKMAMRAAPPAAGDAAGRGPAPDRVPGRGEPDADATSVHARQQAVWAGVAKIQGELSTTLGTRVESARSRSSLQLALENGDLGAKQKEFIDSLEKSGTAESDIVGYVAVINGKLNSAEIYPSSGLFRKMWPALLRASAIEAIKDLAGKDGDGKAPGGKGGQDGGGKLPTAAEVMAFLTDAQAAQGTDQADSPASKVNVKQSAGAAMFESRPAAAPPAEWINRSYLAR
jgi:hypothetical protein